VKNGGKKGKPNDLERNAGVTKRSAVILQGAVIPAAAIVQSLDQRPREVPRIKTAISDVPFIVLVQSDPNFKLGELFFSASLASGISYRRLSTFGVP
jgi:hypothetical protein